MNNHHKLIIFDMDGTLADRETGELLPGVADWFGVYKHVTGGVKLALATNQGGVGLRYWMESGGFGEPDKYPTEDDVWNRINQVIGHLGISQIEIPVYVCFAYQSKSSDKIAPLPPHHTNAMQRWSIAFRKPSPGMLLDAMREAGMSAEDTLMVGDSQEDLTAALAAGCHFQWAWEFFGRENPLEEL